MLCKKIKDLSFYRWVAMGLIGLSFLLYGLLPLNLCLPFSNGIKVGITAVMMVISEIVFWIGGIMLGKEVAMKIKKKINLKSFIRCVKKSGEES